MLFIILFLILFIFIILFVAGNYLYSLVIENDKKNLIPFGSENYKSITFVESSDKQWFKNNFKDIFIKSFDNKRLHAYEVKNKKSNNFVIMVHGYHSNGKELISAANNFNKLGFNILLPDLRGHGKSEGHYEGMGYHDSKDILKWIDYISNNYKNAKIILFGISMGAATVMITSGLNPKNVYLTIEDCGYSSTMDEFSYQLKKLFHLPKFPILYITSLFCKIRSGYFFSEACPIKYVKEAKMPILFIHGTDDKFIPYSMAEKLFSCKDGDKDILLVDGARHVESEKKNTIKYWNKIKMFIETYFK